MKLPFKTSRYQIATWMAVVVLGFVASSSFGNDEDDKKAPAAEATKAVAETPPVTPASTTAPATPTKPATTAPDVKNAKPVKLEVFPADIQLSNVRDRQSIVAQLVLLQWNHR